MRLGGGRELALHPCVLREGNLPFDLLRRKAMQKRNDGVTAELVHGPTAGYRIGEMRHARVGKRARRPMPERERNVRFDSELQRAKFIAALHRAGRTGRM